MSEFMESYLKDTEAPEKTSSEIGDIGEKLAAEYLQRNGFHLIAQNFIVPIGRNRRGALITGEIDLIALDKQVLCFIEVKTRTSDNYLSPLSAINLRKQRQIIRTAKVYRKLFDPKISKIRYDAVSIVLNNKKAPEIILVKGFWDENKFKKKVWADEIDFY